MADASDICHGVDPPRLSTPFRTWKGRMGPNDKSRRSTKGRGSCTQGRVLPGTVPLGERTQALEVTSSNELIQTLL